MPPYAGGFVVLTLIWVTADNPVAAQQPTVTSRTSSVASDSLTAADALFERRTVSIVLGDTETAFGWRLLRPPEPEPGQRYPVVLFLHGAGERGEDNRVQLKYLPSWLAEPANRAAYPCFVIAPQCRPNRRWADVDWAEVSSRPQAAAMTDEMSGVIAMLDEVLSDNAVDPERIYLTGLSMGGFGVWDLAARAPDRFAAILPVCGGGDERLAPRLVKTPTWVAHGDADKAVPVERSRSMVAALKAAGGSPIYVEMPGVGHDSWTPTYTDPEVLAWLFCQRKPMTN